MITERDADRIARLTNWTVTVFHQFEEIDCLEGRDGINYRKAQKNFEAELERLGRALNQVVGRPWALVIREELAHRKNRLAI